MPKIQLYDAIQTANKQNLNSLLKKAQVEVGYLRGRKISIVGYEGSVTFTDFSRKAKNLYQAEINPLRNRMYKYEDLGRYYFTDCIGSLVRWHPEVTEEEEAKADSVIKWYNKITKRLEMLHKNSDGKVLRLAKQTYAAPLISTWDALLNYFSGFRYQRNDWIVKKDEKDLGAMASYRESHKTIYQETGIAIATIGVAIALVPYLPEELKTNSTSVST